MTMRLSGKARDLAGQVFGSLTAVRPVGIHRHGSVEWECQCACGKVTLAPADRLKRGKRVSCGCGRGEASRKNIAQISGWNRGLTYQIKGDDEVFKGTVGWREAVLRARGDVCEICGWNEASCDVHHRIPRCDGGLNTIENAIVLCPNHHRVAHQHGIPGITEPRTSAGAGILVRMMDA